MIGDVAPAPAFAIFVQRFVEQEVRRAHDTAISAHFFAGLPRAGPFSIAPAEERFRRMPYFNLRCC
jgi:hypothetical protein